MPIKVGDKMPPGTLTLATNEGPQKVSAEEFCYLKRKRALTGIPGSIPPTQVVAGAEETVVRRREASEHDADPDAETRL